MAVLETEGLTKIYKRGWWKGKFAALNNLSIQVEEGEIFGFLGPNGAGKTTTIKILLRLLTPTSGSARILGTDVRDHSVRLRVGYMPENPYFYRFLTGEEFLKFFTRLNRIPGKDRKRRIDELLDLVGMSHARHKYIREYSKGMVQRIGLAQALMHDPKLVLLDEPLSGVDPIGRKEIRDLIYAIKEQGRTIFFCSHILSDVEYICNRVAILHHGKLLKMGSLNDLLGRQNEMLHVEVKLPQSVTKDELGVQGTLKENIFTALLPNNDDTRAKVESWRSKGVELLALIPQRKTLEDVFVETIRAEDPNVVLET